MFMIFIHSKVHQHLTLFSNSLTFNNICCFPLSKGPGPVNSLVAGTPTTSTESINWAPPQEGEYSGFIVKYSPADGRTDPEEFVPQNTFSYTFVGLSPGVTYTLSVSVVAGPDDVTRTQSEPRTIASTTGM